MRPTRPAVPFCLFLALCALLCYVPGPVAGQAPVAGQSPAELRLMTFNIRYGTAADGDHAWPHRRDLVAEIIRREDADVLAIQEALDFQLEELAPVLVGYGTHFDHRGEVARVRSARLIAEHASEAGRPTVVMGDLNVPDGSEAVRTFAGLGYRSAVVTLHPEETRGNFNGFTAPSGGSRRIDHVLVGPGLRPTAAAILDDRVDGLFPSDHFPVVAVVVLAGSQP